MRSIRRALLVSAWLALAVPAADAEAPDVEEIPLDFVLSGVCIGQEDIAVTGTQYLRFRQWSDEHGGLHIVYRFGFRGDATGIGTTSGIRYRLVGSSGAAEYHGASSAVVITRQVRFSFVGPGPGNNVQAFETANIKINANGETTVSITDATFRCPD